ncbi:hypothetical protein [Tropicimonas sp. S265A]|uniref:hypothetical protein n=1 Tax=Tropicimonas sp. S265A TaxID=3415134 RepID=UPI003C7E0D14
MARDQIEITLGDEWEELTNADATHVSWQVTSGTMETRATTVANAPDGNAAGFVYRAPEGEADCDIERHFGLPFARRVYGRGLGAGTATVVVAHSDA